jgi:heat shock protein HslJ
MSPTGERGGYRRWLLAAAAVSIGTACDRSPPPTSEEILRNATYLSEWSEAGVVTLTDGEYQAPSAPGTDPEVVITLVDFATGDLDGDGEEDAAAVLVERSGLTEHFYRLHALLRDGRQMHDASSRLIGDRIGLEAVRIEDGVIITDLLVRQPGEPGTIQPTVPITTDFVFTDRGLMPFSSPLGATPPPASPGGPTRALAGETWRIVSIRTGEDPAFMADSSEQTPELSFAEELRDVDGSSGRLFGSTGCNRVLGSYQLSDAGGLRISGIATTRRMCGTARMEFEQLLTLSLGSAIGFEVRDDELQIRFARGVITLSRAPRSAPDTEAGAPASRSGPDSTRSE